MRLVQLFSVVITLAACGGAQPDGTCSTTGFLCYDDANAMECQVGKWVKLPCRGQAGCQRTTDQVTCDMSADVEGDACASTAVGSGLCTADMTGTLECRNDSTSGANTLQLTNSCRTCTVAVDPDSQKNVVSCQQ